MMKKLILNLALFSALTGALSAGEIVTYQGRLKESGSPVTANRSFSFEFCATAAGSGCVASPSTGQYFQVVNGLFKSTFTAPSVNFAAGPWYLRVSVEGTPLSPLERLTHVPYSVYAASASYASALSVASGQGVYASTNVAVAGSLTVSDFSIVPSTEAILGVSTVLLDRNPGAEDVRVAVMGYAVSATPDSNDIMAGGNFEAEVPATMNGMMVGVRAVTRNYGSSPKAIGLMVDSVQNSGTLGETYGVWIATMTGGTQNSRPYALYSGDPNAATYFAGAVGISSVPAYSLAVSSGTGDLFWVAHDAVHAIKFVGDGSGLTGVTGASGTDNTKVLKAGDTMTGQLTLAGSTLTVTGNAFSVGSTGLVVTPAGVGVGTFPTNPLQVSAGGSQYVFAGNSTSADATMNLVHNAGGVARINDNSGTNAAIALALGHVNHVLLNNAGDLGIGAINPSYRLHVSSGAGEAGTVMAVSTGATNIFWVAGDGAHSLKFHGDGSALTGVSDTTRLLKAGDTVTGPLVFVQDTSLQSISINTGGIIVSTGGAITTSGPGTGSVAGNVRGLGAVDLQTARGAATQVAAGNFSVIGGGIANSAVQSYATVGGGFSNYAGGDDSTVSGGYSNGALGYASAVGGGAANSAPGTLAVIAGGDNNSAQGYYAAIGGGAYNLIIGSNSAISGGRYNVLHGTSAVIAGGEYNSVSGMFSSVSGGASNSASSDYAAVGGGKANSAAGMYSAAAGGNYNSASGQMSAVGGGNNNSASGGFSAIPGGDTNQAMGLRSFAAGFRAQSTNDGTFTWADSEGTMVLNSANDRARFKSRGGFLVSGSTDAVMTGQLNRGFLVTGNGLVGVSTGSPQAALDVVSDNAGVSLPVQIWRNSSGAIVSSMSSAGHMMAVRYVGDGSGLTGVTGALGLDVSKVAKAGDTMTGQLTVASTVTVTGSNGQYGLEVSSGVSLAGLLSTNNGRIGVGTSAPLGRLHVAGGLNTGNIVLDDDGAINWGAMDGVVRYNASGALQLRSGGGGTLFKNGGNSEVARFTPEGSLGLGTSLPNAKIDVISTATSVNNYAQIWRDGASVIVASMSSVGSLMAARFVGDGSGLTGLPGDSLGTHIATADLNMTGKRLLLVSTISVSGDSVVLSPFPRDGNYDYAISIGSGTGLNYTSGIGIGYGAFNNYSYGVGVGRSADNNYSYGTGLGYFAHSNYSNGVGVGTGANQNFTNGVGVGGSANNNSNFGTGVGSSASANSTYGVGVGAYASANYNYGVGVGAYSQNNYEYGTSVGAFTSARSSSAALGFYAKAPNQEALALGAGAKANAFQSAAIGAYTVNDTTGTLKIWNNGVTISTGGAIQTTGLGYGSIAGNPRGQGATDLQTMRAAATEVASGSLSSISGGGWNTASGAYSSVPGGSYNQAAGNYSFAAGYAAKSTGQNTFTWSDSGGNFTDNTVPDRALFKAKGGFVITGSTNTVIGATSDRGVMVVNGTIGVSTGVPYAAMDVVSTGTAANVYAQIWRDSGGVAVASVTALGRFSGDGSGLTGVAANDTSRVSKAGDTMVGQLTLGNASTMTVTGNAFSVGSSTLVVTAGKVGIGLLSPVYNLDVAGDINASGSMYAGANLTVNGQVKGNAAGFLFADNNNFRRMQFNGTGTALYDQADTQVLALQSGKVGVGTGSPAEILDLASRVAISTVAGGNNQTDGLFSYGLSGMRYESSGVVYMRVAGSATNIGLGGATVFSGAAYPKVQVQGDMSIGSSFAAFDAPADGLTVQGKVGVGTATPAALLDVRDQSAVHGFVLRVGTGTASDSAMLVVTTGGVVGVGTLFPSSQTVFHAQALAADRTSGVEDVTAGVMGSVRVHGTGSEDAATGGDFESRADGVQNIGYLVGVHTSVERTSGGTGSVGKAIGLYVDDMRNSSAGTGKITDTYGVFIGTMATDNQTNAPYSVFAVDQNARSYFAGKVGLGTPNPQYALEVSSAAGSSDKILMVSTGTIEIFSVKGNGEVYTKGKFIGDGSMLTNVSVGAQYKTLFTNGIESSGLGWGTAAPDARGQGAVDLQTSRAATTQVASGNYAVVSGGENNSANYDYSVVSGGRQNSAGQGYSVVSGGWNNSAPGWYAVVSGGLNDSASGWHSAVVGGRENVSGGENSFVGGGGKDNSGFGAGNRAQGKFSAITGGTGNVVTSSNSAVGGGAYNTVAGTSAVVAGGEVNQASGMFSAVLGGWANSAAGLYSVAVAGKGNSAQGYYSSIGGGYFNSVAGGGSSSVIAGGEMNVIMANAAGSFIGGGYQNYINPFASESVVAGGQTNFIYDGSTYSAIAGGKDNRIGPYSSGSAVLGGSANQVYGSSSSIAGGGDNMVTSTHAFIGGGMGNRAAGQYSFVGGGYQNKAAEVHSAVAGGWLNQANGMDSFVGGGKANMAWGAYSFVGGGAPTGGITGNIAYADYSAVVGGSSNTVTSLALLGFIGGGSENTVAYEQSVVGGGWGNLAGASAKPYAAVVGGFFNKAIGDTSFVGGGGYNTASGQYSAVTGGLNNIASGAYSMVPGGQYATAKGNYSLAAGYRSSSTVNGTFSWADSEGYPLVNDVPDQTRFKAKGGFWVAISTDYSKPGLFVSSANNVSLGVVTGGPGTRLTVSEPDPQPDGNQYVLKVGTGTDPSMLAVSTTGAVSVAGDLNARVWQRVFYAELGASLGGFSIPNLRGNKDAEYKLILRVVEGVMGICNVNLIINGDAVAANYRSQYYGASVAGAVNYVINPYGTAPNIPLGTLGTGGLMDEGALIEGTLYARAGYEPRLYSGTSTSMTSTTTRQVGGGWKGAGAEITSLTIATDLANCLGAGTIIELWAFR